MSVAVVGFSHCVYTGQSQEGAWQLLFKVLGEPIRGFTAVPKPRCL